MHFQIFIALAYALAPNGPFCIKLQFTNFTSLINSGSDRGSSYHKHHHHRTRGKSVGSAAEAANSEGGGGGLMRSNGISEQSVHSGSEGALTTSGKGWGVYKWVKVWYPVIYILSVLRLSGGQRRRTFGPLGWYSQAYLPTPPTAWERHPRGP